MFYFVKLLGIFQKFGVFVCLLFGYFSNEREKVSEIKWKGMWGETGRVEGGKTVFKIYCMRNLC